MEKCRLHYNPSSPGEHMLESDFGAWKLPALLSIAGLFIALASCLA